MGSTLDYIGSKFGVDITRKPPIEIFKINRTIMAQTLCELGFKVGAEIGVQRGVHAQILCTNNPGLKLYCVDYWDHYPGYRDFTRSLAKEYEKAKRVLAPYNCVLVKKFSMDAVNDFENESLDFVYIDAAHDFKHVAMDLCEWSKKVRPDGIVFGHDYKRYPRSFPAHVVDVVGGYMYAYSIVPWFILGMKGQPDGLYQEGTRSWMYVKK